MDRRIKFRHLDVFSAICRNLSLKRAADEIGLTQPAISKTLAELEEILGARLLERSRAGVQITAAGEIFLQFAEQSSGAIRQGIRAVQGNPGRAGRLRIGALPSVASFLLPRALHRLTQSIPDLLIDIHEGPHRDLTAKLRSGALDLVFGRLGLAESMEGLSFHQFYTEDVVVVTAPDSPALEARSFAALAGFQVLYPPQDSAIRPLVARALMAQGVPLYENRIECASAACARALVLEAPGSVWFTSRGVVAHDLAEGRLEALQIDTGATLGAVGAMARRSDVMSPVSRRFLQEAAREADILIQSSI
ncbi:MAG: pca operon transcription factor PcaQ [Pseudomonadota bacterium]